MCTIALYLIVRLDRLVVYLVSFSSIHLSYSFLDLMSVYVFAGFSFNPAICAVVISCLNNLNLNLNLNLNCNSFTN